MLIDWGALGLVLVVGLGAGVGAVMLFSLGVVGLSQRATARRRGEPGTSGTGLAVLCFAACVAVVAYGLYLIVRR